MVEFSVADNDFSATERRKIRSVVGEVVAANSRRKLLVLGDSTQLGRGSGTGGTGEVGARVKSPPSSLARLLTSLGVPARADAFFGDASVGTPSLADYVAYNPNVSFGAGWAMALPGNGRLARGWWANSTTTNACTFTPEKSADRFDIYYIGGAGTGNATFTVTDSSGTLATVDSNTGAVYGVKRTTVTRSVADRTPISIQRNGTGTALYIGSVDPWNSTLPELCILNAARSGGRATDAINAADQVAAKPFIDAIAADLHYIEYGLNEKQMGDSIATYVANMTSLAANCQALGALAIGISAPATNGNAYDLTSDWRQPIVDLANSLGVPLVNHYDRMVSREIATGDYFDTVHLTARGSAVKARAMADLLAA